MTATTPVFSKAVLQDCKDKDIAADHVENAMNKGKDANGNDFKNNGAWDDNAMDERD